MYTVRIHEMHARLRGSKSLLTLRLIKSDEMVDVELA